jgi:hypothetical protein
MPIHLNDNLVFAEFLQSGSRLDRAMTGFVTAEPGHLDRLILRYILRRNSPSLADRRLLMIAFPSMTIAPPVEKIANQRSVGPRLALANIAWLNWSRFSNNWQRRGLGLHLPVTDCYRTSHPWRSSLHWGPSWELLPDQSTTKSIGSNPFLVLWLALSPAELSLEILTAMLVPIALVLAWLCLRIVVQMYRLCWESDLVIRWSGRWQFLSLLTEFTRAYGCGLGVKLQTASNIPISVLNLIILVESYSSCTR